MAKAALDATRCCLTCLPDEGEADSANAEPQGNTPKDPPHYDWIIETYAVENLTEDQLSHALTITEEGFVEL